jgi:preprotein translocase subunit SecG
MTTVVLVIHLLVAMALVGVILLQRSEGGGLGIGGGGAGGFLSARGSANLLTRTTAILAIAFVATSMTLAILSGRAVGPSSILESLPAGPVEPVPKEPAPAEPAPAEPAPAEPATPAPPVAN